MTKTGMVIRGIVCTLLLMSSVMAADVSMKISGPGAVNDSTIKAGEPVFLDIYWANDKDRPGAVGFSTGFKLVSEDMTKIIHPSDSGSGLNPRGDVTGHNGWQDKSTWDIGLWVSESDWDGEFPELIGFGALKAKTVFKKHEMEKKLSIKVIFPETGKVTVEASPFPPSNTWKLAMGDDPDAHETPNWMGPYTYTVVE